jgi:hypothetical protein
VVTFGQWWTKINHLIVKCLFSPYENQRSTNKVIDLLICPPLLLGNKKKLSMKDREIGMQEQDRI